jgi:hypothetical protein
MGDDIVVDVLEIGELLVKMTGQKQRAVRQLPLADLERALAKLQREVSRTQRNRDHERRTAQNKPLDRAEPRAKQRAGF